VDVKLDKVEKRGQFQNGGHKKWEIIGAGAACSQEKRVFLGIDSK
jgi:hypothetical protein